MAKVESAKSQVKIKDNQQTFVKNRGGFHPESDEDLRSYVHPGQPDHDYEEFRKAQGDDQETRSVDEQPQVKGESTSLIGNLFTLVRHPRLAIKAVSERFQIS